MYDVTCSSCGQSYDALQAPDCSCLQPVRSVRCPHCEACFCRDRAQLDKFWQNAPAGMWARRRARPEAASETLTRPLILFADDDPTGRAIATRVIQSLGYGIVVAANGEEALNKAREHRPELIITDALMPRLDGREMGRIIKSEIPETKVVVITSVYKDPRYKYEALKDFAVDDYLKKPVNPTELRDLILKHLKQ
ncbi:MAG TPA: response regulator [Thermoanaerobaculia bacterium]|nr:response regulator [Thermoanaerobaculia bacterium]